MPMIDLVAPAGRFTENEIEGLGAKLTRIIIEWESGTDIAGYEQAAWAWVHEARQVLVAGRRREKMALPLYKVIATGPKGSLDERRRRVASDRDRQSVWCVMAEVPDGNWGAGGLSVRLRDLAAGFGITPDHPRWVDLRFDQR